MPYKYSPDDIEIEEALIAGEEVEKTDGQELPTAAAQEEPPPQPTRQIEGVRPETVAVWDRLRSQGEQPSVRRIYAAIGGAYGKVVEECKLLRIEESGTDTATVDDSHTGNDTPPQDDPSDEDDTPDDEPAPIAAEHAPVTGEIPTREGADAALRGARQALQTAQTKRQRLNGEIEKARQAYEESQQTVRDLQQRLLAEEPVQDKLEPAYQSRDGARFRLEDWEAQVDALDAEIAQAEQAVAQAEYTSRLVAYNARAESRVALRDNLQAAIDGLAEALQALVEHDEKQREAARACGFDGLPGDVIDPASKRNGYTPLAFHLYGRLAELVTPPHWQTRERLKLHVASLAEVDIASVPLTVEQAQELSAPDRTRGLGLVPDARGPNFRNLLTLGIPALLLPSSTFPLRVTEQQAYRIRQAFPGRVQRVAPGGIPIPDDVPQREE